MEPQPPAEQAKPTEEEMPDWMQVVQSAVAGTSELDIATVTAASSAPAELAPEEIPADAAKSLQEVAWAQHQETAALLKK